MDKDEPRKYESIDALIMAAEVLERAEAIAKEQLALQDNLQICNCCISNEVVIDRCKHLSGSTKGDQLTEGLLQTIDYIKGLHTTEKWSELFEGKNKSDNRILYRELSDLKKKLNCMKEINSRPCLMTSVSVREEDEDTSTASEDEGYNKYDSININDNVDDITDDASECEETPTNQIKVNRNNSAINRMKHSKNQMKAVTAVDKLSNIDVNPSRTINHRKRKCTYDRDQIVAIATDAAPSRSDQISPNHSITVHNQPKSGNITCCSSSLPLLSASHAVSYKTLLKVHQPVDIHE